MDSQRGFIGIVVIFVVLAVVGAAGFYVVLQSNKQAPTPITQLDNQSDKKDVSLEPQNEINQLPVVSPKQEGTPTPSSRPKPTQTVTPKPTPAPKLRSSVSSKIDSCRTISTAGKYSLSGDLINTKSEPCIKIQNVSNVSLDCQNYTITSKNENYNIYVKGSSDFKINNCKLVSSLNIPIEKGTQHVLKIEDSNRGDLYSNTIAGNFAEIRGSSFVTVRNSIFTNQFLVYKSNNTTIKDNNFSSTATVAITLQEGNNNSLISNFLDGKSDGIFANKIGADDVVFLDNEDNDLIQGNTLQNAYECAIEFNRVAGAKIIGNKANNTGLSFLCGWHYVSAKGVTVKDNVVNNSPSLFWFFRERALRSNESYVYFQDNIFENNKLSNPKTGTGFSFAAMIDFNRSIIPLQNYIIGNNILINNDFTKLVGPLRLAPANVVTDGGGNICSGAEEEALGGGDSIPFCN